MNHSTPITQDALHFCSTPRNVFLSIGQAWRDDRYRHHLLMIDQPAGKDLPLITALTNNPGPFASVSILRKGSGIIGKRRVRKAVFRQLEALIRQRSVGRVYTGNDRRIEFQYTMHALNQLGVQTDAIYLEDGVNSYLPFHPSHRGLRAIADPVFEPLLKKVGYGSWYDRSGAVGCSRWIDERRLTFPELLQTNEGPPVTPLNASDYTEAPAAEHLSGLGEAMTGTQTRFEGELLLVLPHSNDLLGQYRDADSFRKVIAPLLGPSNSDGGTGGTLKSSRAQSARVKYHPNETLPVLEGLVEELPRKMPMEMLMSQCVFERIVGDTSAALLGAKWLQPQAHVMSVRNNRPGSELLFDLMAQAGVDVINAFDEAGRH